MLFIILELIHLRHSLTQYFVLIDERTIKHKNNFNKIFETQRILPTLYRLIKRKIKKSITKLQS